MWVFIVRKLITYIPVYLSIILLVMLALRVNDPVYAYLGKSSSPEQIRELREDMGLDRPVFIDIGVWRRPWRERTAGGEVSHYWVPGRIPSTHYAEWSAPLEPGAYEVQLRWPVHEADAAERVSVTIEDGTSELATAEVDQSDPEAAGVWRTIGTHEFHRGTGRVALSNRAEGRVLAAEARFVPAGAEGGGSDGAGASGAVVIGPGDPGLEFRSNHWTPRRFLTSLYSNQYYSFVGRVLTFDFKEKSWKQEGRSVGNILTSAIPPSVSITIPLLGTSACLGILIALVAAFFRGRPVDQGLMLLAVVGMSVSFLVYIIFGQFFGAFLPEYHDAGAKPFAIRGYEPWIGFGENGLFFNPGNWVRYCMLPVIIGVIVALGYDTRFYRAVMVEESTRDYITTAVAKGASKRKVMFVHMLKNALIPIITRIMATMPFLITGNILLEIYFGIPGMGFELITAINAKDFPVIQAFVSVLAAFFILTVILTDVLYALVDPRVRLS